LFIKVRSELILEEVRRRCGEVSSPREDERVKTVNDIENRVRDCVDAVLTKKAGAAYWKQCVPNDAKNYAAQRIDETLARNPNLKREEFESPRRKLDYLTLAHYSNIIDNNGNWPDFAPVFKRQEDFRKYLRSFGEYRNALAHNRKLTVFEEKSGDLAIFWLSSVLTGDIAQPEDDADEE
jgi:hypothetical protein